MSMRYRRSMKLGPGLRLNASKSGLSVTFGPRGYHHTVSTSGRRTTTVGLPGSGLYWQESRGGRRRPKSVRASQTPQVRRAVSPPTQPGRAIAHAGLFAPTYEKEFARALGEMTAGRNREALDRFERAAAADTKQRSIADDLLAGSLCVMLGEPARAIPHLEKVAASSEELPDALMRHYLPDGLPFELKIGDHVHIAVLMGTLAATVLLATAYEAVERYDEAIGVLQQLLDAHPEPAVKLLLCLLHAHKQEWQDVVTVAAGSTNDDDIGLALCVIAGEALCELGLPDGALQSLSTALRSSTRDPELRKQARYVRARAYTQLGQQARGSKELQQLYAIDPAYRDVASQLGLPQVAAPHSSAATAQPSRVAETAAEPRSYRFEVTAPAADTLAWLRGRAEKSGVWVGKAGKSGFRVTWRGDVVPPGNAVATVEFSVKESDRQRSVVTATVTNASGLELDVIRDFAGALGERMTSPRPL
jgi:tetratricopeptide (TPR) repeat protein